MRVHVRTYVLLLRHVNSTCSVICIKFVTVHLVSDNHITNHNILGASYINAQAERDGKIYSLIGIWFHGMPLEPTVTLVSCDRSESA